MASVWDLGTAVNVEVPSTIRVEVKGSFSDFVGPKDLILHLVGLLTAQGANFRALEFSGETIERLSTSGRLVLCNMSVEAGATSGMVPADQETARYLREEAHVNEPLDLVASDRDAEFEKVVIGSCTNGRLDDLAQAARIVRGRRVAEGTRMLVFPASARIYAQALQLGYL